MQAFLKVKPCMPPPDMFGFAGLADNRWVVERSPGNGVPLDLAPETSHLTEQVHKFPHADSPPRAKVEDLAAGSLISQARQIRPHVIVDVEPITDHYWIA